MSEMRCGTAAGRNLFGAGGDNFKNFVLTFGSLFAGAGGFDLGFEKAGLRGLWNVEIDANCRKLLKARFPNAAQYDDVRTVGRHNLAPVDIISFGFPCQDLSVAGNREGLAGKRSGLFYEATRIVDELQPAYCIFENVPGLLSSNSGHDFLAVLVELDRIGYHGAWTTLDAQYWGVPQRRVRVFGCFARGDIGASRCVQILSLSESLCGNFEACEATRQRVAGTITGGANGSRSHGKKSGTDREGFLVCAEVAPTLNAHFGEKQGLENQHIDGGGDCSLPSVARCLNSRTTQRQDFETETLIPTRRGGFFDDPIAFSSKDHGADAGAVCPTLRACPHDESHANGGGPPAIAFHPTQDPIVSTDGTTHSLGCGSVGGQASVAVAFKPSHFTRGKDGAPDTISPPLSADAADAADADKGDQDPLIFQTRVARNGRGSPDELCPALNGTNAGETSDMRPCVLCAEVSPTLGKESFSPAKSSSGQMVDFCITTPMAVRRLVPVECERLMSWPDGHTSGFSDSTRYKMCGNGVVSNVAYWIGKRLAQFA